MSENENTTPVEEPVEQPLQEETTTEQSEPEPAKTESGVIINDPERTKKKLVDWSTEELLAFLKGELEGVPNNLVPGIVKEYRRRESLEAAWSDQEVLDFFRQAITPETTSTGAWKNDITRSNRAPADWSDAELEAWALGEIEPRGKATADKLARELVNRFKLSGPAEDIEAVLKQYHHKNDPKEAEPAPAPEAEAVPETKAPVAPVAQGALTAMNVGFIDSTLDRYADAVMPGKEVGEETGGKAQRDLENLFQYVLRLEGKALKEAMNRINVFINKHRDDLFDPSNAYRFVHLLKGNPKYQIQHVNLIELFLMTGAQNKARRQQIDMRHMLKDMSNDKIEILVDYFTNHAKV